MASRTELRPALYCLQSSGSVGSRSPGWNSPLMMEVMMPSITRSTTEACFSSLSGIPLPLSVPPRAQRALGFFR